MRKGSKDRSPLGDPMLIHSKATGHLPSLRYQRLPFYLAGYGGSQRATSASAWPGHAGLVTRSIGAEFGAEPVPGPVQARSGAPPDRGSRRKPAAHLRPTPRLRSASFPARLERCRDVPPREVWLPVAAARLAFGQRDVPVGKRLVRDLAEQVADDVEPGALLVVGVRDVPGGPRGIGGGQHRVPGSGVVVPAAVGLQVHGRQLPDLPRVIDPAFQPAGLLAGADLQPVLQQQHPGIRHRLLESWHQREEPLGFLRRAEAHHRLDAGPVVPAAVEDHDLAGGREVLDVPLDVHLRLFPLGGGGQGHDPEYARADPLGDPLDRASLPGGVPALEHDADLRSRVLHPLLHGDQLTVQDPHLAFVLLALHLRGRPRLGLRPGGRRGRPGLRVVTVTLVLLRHVAISDQCGDLGAVSPSPGRAVPVWRPSPSSGVAGAVFEMPARYRSLAQSLGGFGAGTPGRSRGTQTRSARGETMQVTGVDISIDSPSTPTAWRRRSEISDLSMSPSWARR